jgi:hypothetical protein
MTECAISWHQVETVATFSTADSRKTDIVMDLEFGDKTVFR